MVNDERFHLTSPQGRIWPPTRKRGPAVGSNRSARSLGCLSFRSPNRLRLSATFLSALTDHRNMTVEPNGYALVLCRRVFNVSEPEEPLESCADSTTVPPTDLNTTSFLEAGDCLVQGVYFLGQPGNFSTVLQGATRLAFGNAFSARRR